MNTSQFLIAGWTWNPVAIAGLVMALVAFVWRFGLRAQIGFVVLAASTFLFALVSPLQALANGYLFSAHMLQHAVLLLAVPAFCLLALPRNSEQPRLPRLARHPVTGWICGVGAMWLWHVPNLCNASATSPWVYTTQTVSLLLCGGIFWYQILAPNERDRLPPPKAILYLFTACVACSMLGIILTISPVIVCSAYQHPVDRLGMLNTIRQSWGMTPEKDQQLGGLLMWVPMCVVYVSAILVQCARWFAPVRTQTSIS